MKRSRTFTWSLAFVVLIIWSTISYQIYQSFSSDSGDVKDEDPLLSVKNKELFVYRADVRDPFIPTIIRHPAKDTARSQREHPPTFTLAGILMNRNRRTAFVEAPDGSTFFLHEGDTLQGLKLLRISENKVSYLYRNRRSAWVLRDTR